MLETTIKWVPPATYYVYAADLYCPVCAQNIEYDLRAKGIVWCHDSNSWPQEYPQSSGETDTPEHCSRIIRVIGDDGLTRWSTCDRFLGLPLTSDGVAYVQQIAEDDIARDGAVSVIVQGWLDYYEVNEENEEK